MNTLYADTRLGGVVEWVYGDPERADMGIPKNLLECVCYLCTRVGGQWQFGGTAFFVGYPTRNFEHVYAVTARHCIEEIHACGGDVCLRINDVQGGSKIFTVKADWFYPESQAVDLAILPLDLPTGHGLRFRTMNVSAPLGGSPEEFLAERFGPGDEVLITGLFSMRYGAERNYPIVRAGILSAMLDEPLKDDKTGDEYEAYLIEVRSIGGLSGSPVFAVYRPPAPWKPKGEVDFRPREMPVMMPQSYNLLGLIRGHWDMEKVLVPAFNNELTQVNMGMAVVTPAHEIYVLLRSEGLKADREEREREHNAQNAPTPD